MENNINFKDILKADNSFSMRYFVMKFGVLPQKMNFRVNYDKKKFIQLIFEEFKNEIEEHFFEHYIESTPEDNDVSVDIILKGVIVMIHSDYQIKLLYIENTQSIINRVVEILHQCEKNTIEDFAFYMITNSDSGLFLKRMSFEHSSYELNEIYNDDVIEKLTDVENFIKNEKNGLMLMTGPPGGGKSNLIKELIIKYKEYKFIYLSLKLVNSIESTVFIDLFANHPDSIVILEDCESLVTSRELGNSNISTLLNISDGLLSSSIRLKFILTMNYMTTTIALDDAIIRPGRLRVSIFFNELSISKTNLLFKKINIDYVSDKPLILTNILNYNQNNGMENNERKKIGF